MFSINIHTINPYIRSAMYSVLRGPNTSVHIDKSNSYAFGRTAVHTRTLFDYELVYVESGTFVLLYDNKEYRLIAGQFVLIRPGISHAFTQLMDFVSQPNIHFDFIYNDTSEAIKVSFRDKKYFSDNELKLVRKDIFEKYNQSPIITFKDTKKALNLFYNVINSNAEPLHQKGAFIQLIDLLIHDNFPDFFSIEDDPVSQLKKYIDSGQDFKSNLDDFEKLFTYNKFYLEKLFKEKYGMSIMKYRDGVKWLTAKSLLSKYSISYVADRLGYTTVYAFSNAFKKKYGLSPTDYKRNLQ